ncbi:MAG TPA: 3-deoxy-8-phosphooctulonate synthase [Chitinophagaceae bacterium]|nr:3-deoxy-8-phosphooctulonate synthase [Chitinophagaceae bacterium]
MSIHKVKVGNVVCGDDPLFLISGPCVIEEESVMLRTAEQLREVSDRLRLPVIFKSSFLKDNRSSLEYYQGPGLDRGLAVLARIREEFGFPILTDIHYPDHAEAAGQVVDVIQIPAYLCMQSGLMVAAAVTGKAINIKHGQFLDPANMIHPVRKCEESGNRNIILTERGFTMGYNDLVVDPRSFHQLSRLGYPVVFDITHSIRRYGIPSSEARGGSREFLPVLSRAGVAAGVDGVFIETHPEPEKALCDAASQLCVYDLEEFMKPLLELHAVELTYRKRQQVPA